MIRVDELAERIDPASISYINEIRQRISAFWKETTASDKPGYVPEIADGADSGSSSFKEMAMLWNRLADGGSKTQAATRLPDVAAGSLSVVENLFGELQAGATERPAAPADGAENGLLTLEEILSSATEAIGGKEVRDSSESTASHSEKQSVVREIARTASESVANARETASRVSEPLAKALGLEAGASSPVSSTMEQLFAEASSSADFRANGGDIESLASLNEIHETLATALGVESRREQRGAWSTSDHSATAENMMFNTVAPPAAAMLPQSAILYEHGGDPSSNRATNVTMSGISITVNGNDGEAVANGIANSLAAKTQQAYMGDGSVGR
jgi:hypothetical protein